MGTIKTVDTIKGVTTETEREFTNVPKDRIKRQNVPARPKKKSARTKAVKD